MTPKELLYIEDALGHEKQMQTAFQGLSAQMSDQELQQFVQGLTQKQSDHFKKLYSLLS